MGTRWVHLICTLCQNQSAISPYFFSFVAPALSGYPPDPAPPTRTCKSMTSWRPALLAWWGAVAGVVGIRCGALSGNMKVQFQAARSIG